MRPRGILAATLAAATIAATGCANATSNEGDAPEHLVVWLMTDARDGWQDIVDATNEKFQRRHPNIQVDVRYQSWSSYLTKFDAALADQNPPDVIEMGNTQTMKYMAAGALLDISGKRGMFDNSGEWLTGLEQSCSYQGKLFCVPYYAGSRAVMYRTDMFEEVGVKGTPDSLDEFEDTAAKLMEHYGDRANFSALFFPGKYWYYAMSFVYDYGGRIAVQKDGKWEGALDSPEARRALSRLEEMVAEYSRASKTSDEAEQYQVVAEGDVAMFYDNAWALPLVVGEEEGNPQLQGKMSAFPMPSHIPGETMPSFLGGSDLAVPAASDAPDAALDWIKTYTSTGTQTKLVEKGGVLPNNTNLLDLYKDDPVNAAFAEAARKTWFVPTAKNWATVEQRNIIPNMLVDIFTGRETVEQATAKASAEITKVLNS